MEYKTYKDLDYDFPDTSNIINKYLGCQAITHDGKKCEIPAEFGGYKNKYNQCDNYCYYHINLWYQKIFDMKLKTFDNLYDVNAEIILINYTLNPKYNNLNMFISTSKFLGITPSGINEYDNFSYKLKKNLISNESTEYDKQSFWNFLKKYYNISSISIFYDLVDKNTDYLLDTYLHSFENILKTSENTQISNIVLMSQPMKLAKHLYNLKIEKDEL